MSQHTSVRFGEREKIRIEKSGKALDNNYHGSICLDTPLWLMTPFFCFGGFWCRGREEGRVPYQRLSPSFFLIPSPFSTFHCSSDDDKIRPHHFYAAMSTKTHIEMYISNNVNQNRPTEGGNKAKVKKAELLGKFFFFCFFNWCFQNMTGDLFHCNRALGKSREKRKKKKTLEDTYLV